MNDDLIRSEQLSALVDGEASFLHIQAALSFAESDEGQQSWAMYHLIGDVLRSPELAHHCQHDILSAVRAHMDREPVRGIHVPGISRNAADSLNLGELEQVVLADRGTVGSHGSNVTPLSVHQAANSSVFRWKMAAGLASVAAVAAIGWGVMITGAGDGYVSQGGASLAAVQPTVIVAAVTPSASQGEQSVASVGEEAAPLGSEAQASSVIAVASPNGQTVMLRDPRLDELLASHPQRSSVPNLQMPASFLRNSSFALSGQH